MSDFIVIGENIHCTRIVLLGGRHTVELDGGGRGVAFKHEGADRLLPIPPDWGELSPAFGDGKVKHIALAIRQALHGEAEDRKAGEDYLVWAGRRQVDAGARFLDVNVDEYSNDSAERSEVMRWLAGFLSERFDVPLSIDSSSGETLAAGLAACRKQVGDPMVNSVSLERTECIDVIVEFGANAVVSAAGRDQVPSTVEERTANFEEIVKMLDEVGVARDHMYLDPLVFPISTDPIAGAGFLDATSAAKERFDGAHLTGGFSNVSFGMPQRKLLNMVFTHLCVEAGADSGIIDPIATSPADIEKLDVESESFRLAKAFLRGDDMYGTEFIAAHREGRLN